MADEPVVVSKARPLKASNGAEGKTKPTFAICVKERAIVKNMVSCEGGKWFINHQIVVEFISGLRVAE